MLNCGRWHYVIHVVVHRGKSDMKAEFQMYLDTATKIICKKKRFWNICVLTVLKLSHLFGVSFVCFCLSNVLRCLCGTRLYYVVAQRATSDMYITNQIKWPGKAATLVLILFLVLCRLLLLYVTTSKKLLRDMKRRVAGHVISAHAMKRRVTCHVSAHDIKRQVAVLVNDFDNPCLSV